MSEVTSAPVGAMIKAAVPIAERGVVLRDIESLYRFASAVANSELAPKDFRGKPDSVMVAMQMGMEVGLSPMSALQNIAVINGRPSIWGDAQLAIVRSSGDLAAFEETETNDEIEPIFRELCFEDDASKRKAMKIQIAKMQAKLNKNAEDYGVSCFVLRRGFNEAFGRFTVADAKKAQLWGKQGPWSQYPSRMLKFRARSFLLRDQFGDALKGMLSREEAGDFIDISSTATVAPAEATPGVHAPVPIKQLTGKKNTVVQEPAPETPATTTPTTEPAPGNVVQLSPQEAKPVEPVKENPPAAAAVAETAQPPVTSAASTPTSSTPSDSTAKTGASTAPTAKKAEAEVPPSKMPAGWLPTIDASNPPGTLASLNEWLKTEELTEAELLKWAQGRNLAKAGQSLTDLAVAKIIGILKNRNVVRVDIIKAR
jgi:hypothetical protein